MNSDSSLPGSRGGLMPFVPTLACAGACIALMRSGFLAYFFLVPLGFCSTAFGPAAAWFCLVLAVLGNAAVSVGLALYHEAAMSIAAWDAVYFTVIALGFTWIMAGNPPQRRQVPIIPRVRTLFRFVAASLAGVVLFLLMAFAPGRENGIAALLGSRLESLTSMYIASSGADAAQQGVELSLAPNGIIEAISSIALRGGAFVSLVFVFFFSRQMSYILAMLLKRRGRGTAGDLIGFHVPRWTIWAVILCLPAVVAFRAISLEAVEIIAWNLLVVSAVMYLAQGAGIVLFTFARRPIPGLFRILGALVVMLLVFNPGLIILALVALVLLGIAENWLPLRVVKQDTPVS
ncbi:MAG: YybS family protein [Treponema sp.]|jgi:hypothetical protein|nr:YybS family protein [Treponema sp.]